MIRISALKQTKKLIRKKDECISVHNESRDCGYQISIWRIQDE
jgi:hypothetical protein